MATSTTIVTMTLKSSVVTQVVSKEDPADLYKELEQCLKYGSLAAYSMLTLSDHVMQNDSEVQRTTDDR
jgi:hypothetical protein